MREESEIFYIKIMYMEVKVLPNTLGRTITFSMFRKAVACVFS
jgi:hypothetical protein